MDDSEELPRRLRRETADLHAAVEAAIGLPGSIRSRDDYLTLLSRLCTFHKAVEDLLASPGWAQQWDQLGIDLAGSRRAHLLERDIIALRAEPPGGVSHVVDIVDFAGALGCLYVVEGSSLGGRVIGPGIRRELGNVPTSFFESDERDHPTPWRSLKAALLRYRGDQGAVIAGARATFRAFERYVATPSGDLNR